MYYVRNPRPVALDITRSKAASRMRHPPTEEPSLSSWRAYKERGKSQWDRDDYEGALSSYAAALNPSLMCPSAERQIILSNMVACRLKIGGPAQARAALDNAKQCVAINDRWAKGYIRLASAYIALGGHSNDACNALQRALNLDPGNPTARQMLVKELRRDRAGPEANHPSGSYSSARHSDFSQFNPPPDDNSAFDVDNAIPVMDRIRFSLGRVQTWYRDQSNELKTILKILLVLVALYVAFGGRFGFEAQSRRQLGNYEKGNAYDRFYDKPIGYSSTSKSWDSKGRSMYQTNSRDDDDSRYDGGYRDPAYDSTRRTRRSGMSFHLPDIWDGSLASMALIAGILYICHRNGINIFQVLMVLNLMGGRRGGRRVYPRPGLGGFGGYRPYGPGRRY